MYKVTNGCLCLGMMKFRLGLNFLKPSLSTLSCNSNKNRWISILNQSLYGGLQGKKYDGCPLVCRSLMLKKNWQPVVNRRYSSKAAFPTVPYNFYGDIVERNAGSIVHVFYK